MTSACYLRAQELVMLTWDEEAGAIKYMRVAARATLTRTRGALHLPRTRSPYLHASIMRCMFPCVFELTRVVLARRCWCHSPP